MGIAHDSSSSPAQYFQACSIQCVLGPVSGSARPRNTAYYLSVPCHD